MVSIGPRWTGAAHVVTAPADGKKRGRHAQHRSVSRTETLRRHLDLDSPIACGLTGSGDGRPRRMPSEGAAAPARTPTERSHTGCLNMTGSNPARRVRYRRISGCWTQSRAAPYAASQTNRSNVPAAVGKSDWSTRLQDHIVGHVRLAEAAELGDVEQLDRLVGEHDADVKARRCLQRLDVVDQPR